VNDTRSYYRIDYSLIAILLEIRILICLNINCLLRFRSRTVQILFLLNIILIFFKKKTIWIADWGAVPALLAHARDGNGSANVFLNTILFHKKYRNRLPYSKDIIHIQRLRQLKLPYTTAYTTILFLSPPLPVAGGTPLSNGRVASGAVRKRKGSGSNPHLGTELYFYSKTFAIFFIILQSVNKDNHRAYRRTVYYQATNKSYEKI
jgi:hypothetical protein